MPDESRDERRERRLEAAFAEEQDRTLAFGARVMVAVLAIIFVWVNVENGWPAAVFFYPFLFTFGVLLLAPYLLSRAGRRAAWHAYVFPALWVIVFVVIVLVENPLDIYHFPIQMRLGFGNEIYLFLIIAAAAFTYSWRVVLWTGLVAALVWAAAVMIIHARPETISDVPVEVWRTLSVDEQLAILNSPFFIHFGRTVRQILVMLVSSWILAAFVWRSRTLVYRQAEAERQRTNLSRYFSANLVDELAQTDRPFEETRAQDIAVLFVDIVGFTTLAAEQTPQQVIRLLRDFHERVAAQVFAHGGTLDKYIGDAVMATFGTPRPGPRDASTALRCAEAILASIAQWNRERRAGGSADLAIGAGIHYGPVVMGDIGGGARFEFAVVGDTVNVASRLERLTRELGTDLVVSDALVQRVRAEDGDAATLLAPFELAANRSLRGRSESIDLWLKRDGRPPSPR